MLKSTIFVKLKPTDPLRTTIAMLPEENFPRMVRLATLATVILVSRLCSPGKNTIVVLEVKYSSVSCAYSESVAQWVLCGQDEHEVAVGVTQYTFSAEQWGEMFRMSSAVRHTRVMTDKVIMGNGCI